MFSIPTELKGSSFVIPSDLVINLIGFLIFPHARKVHICQNNLEKNKLDYQNVFKIAKKFFKIQDKFPIDQNSNFFKIGN